MIRLFETWSLSFNLVAKACQSNSFTNHSPEYWNLTSPSVHAWSALTVSLYKSEQSCCCCCCCYMLSGARFLKVPKTFQVRKAIAKSPTLRLQSCFIHVFLIWTEVFFIQEVSGVYNLDTDELKHDSFTGPKTFRGFRETGPWLLACMLACCMHSCSLAWMIACMLGCCTIAFMLACRFQSMPIWLLVCLLAWFNDSSHLYFMLFIIVIENLSRGRNWNESSRFLCCFAFLLRCKSYPPRLAWFTIFLFPFLPFSWRPCGARGQIKVVKENLLC